mmetsp:Transcript_105616/g.340605  ORF Transcript_105616/g.340605 Transcript_105616/m.340605 type:complete len:245 (+) Transcript_105616:1424-2158(+)
MLPVRQRPSRTLARPSSSDVKFACAAVESNTVTCSGPQNCVQASAQAAPASASASSCQHLRATAAASSSAAGGGRAARISWSHFTDSSSCPACAADSASACRVLVLAATPASCISRYHASAPAKSSAMACAQSTAPHSAAPTRSGARSPGAEARSSSKSARDASTFPASASASSFINCSSQVTSTVGAVAPVLQPRGKRSPGRAAAPRRVALLEGSSHGSPKDGRSQPSRRTATPAARAARLTR